MIVQKNVEVGQVDSDDELLCIATFLPVQGWLDVFPFLRMTSRVEKQMREAHGLVRYGLRTNLFRKYFWTFSVWKDRASVNIFVAAEPHATAMWRFQKWAGTGAAFAEWNSTDGFINWNEAIRRLKNPTFYYKLPG